jgi:transcriptional regulator with XRE-family HTH domain
MPMAPFYPDLYQTALALLVEAREKAGLTQETFAARFEQSEAFVSSYENGKRLLDPGEYIALARTIGADPYELLKQAEAASL